MGRHDGPDGTTASVLRAFTVVYEPQILERARNIVAARNAIAGDYVADRDRPELVDDAIGSCAAALVDVLVARALVAGAFGFTTSESKGPR